MYTKELFGISSLWFISEYGCLIRGHTRCSNAYDADFGYSWTINKTTFGVNETCYFYGGTSLGFYSLMIYLPESETCLVLLNNTSNFPRLELGDALLKVLVEGE